MAETAAIDTASLGYEQARDELIEVVNRLEQGGATLEESLKLWERGEALAARCEEWLLGARKRLEAARAGTGAGSADGTAEPADPTAEGDRPA
ncbi:exodeoxyribonuclease VII small subunit [Leucobacter weissii]|uniref:Exodeoxyribonuclease 7 small subunit n=1 Tax=Leucobacter weissii TaxID=1983706 RepID=A0A939MGY3_9MICO|nr:exodeoxyribonuclease VII small subunit [Leucobacter weissii]MBO1900708.1 exodeoxyribonuclease VII small subunit [Leucobacter weissii]